MRSSPRQVFHHFGVSHRTTPVSVRERLGLTPAEAAERMDRQRASGRCAAILSTCNRFEVYWTGFRDILPADTAGARWTA